MKTNILKRDIYSYDFEKPIKVAIIDDPHLFYEALGELHETTTSLEIIAVTKDINELINFYSYFLSDAIDIVLMDLGSSPQESIDFIENFIIKYPTVKVIVLTDHDEQSYLLQSFRVGVSGYLLKGMTVSSIIEFVQLVANGGIFIDPKVTRYMIDEYVNLIDRKDKGRFKQEKICLPLHLLTKRECEVLQLLAEAKTNSEVAQSLSISEKTVKNHVISVFRKLNVETRTAAVVTAVKNGWVEI